MVLCFFEELFHCTTSMNLHLDFFNIMDALIFDSWSENENISVLYLELKNYKNRFPAELSDIASCNN